MRPTIAPAATLAAFLLASVSPARPNTPSPRRAQSIVFRNAIERVRPAIVKIIADSTRLPAAATKKKIQKPIRRFEPVEVGPGLGYAVAEGPSTGVICSPDGLIVTSSFHFVRMPSKITVHLADGRSFPGKLLGRDQVRKLAYIRIDASNLPVPRWTDRSMIRPGMWAVALGWGFGGRHPAPSVGIVSAVNRMGGDVMQTDAKLSPANYGGPLVNVEGRVLGICVPLGTLPGETAGVELYDSGIGFAIGGWTLADVAPTLAAGQNIYRGFIGIRLSDSDKIGAFVVGVADPSPAKNAGIRPRDRIIQIDNHAVPHVHTLLRHMNYRPAGESVRLIILRGQQHLEKTLELTAWKELGGFDPEPPTTTQETKPPEPPEQPKEKP